MTTSLSEYTNVNIGKNLSDLEIADETDGYSGVEIIVDDDTTYFSGTQTGRVLTIKNQWGTQEQADDILSHIRGVRYQPYSVTSAYLDPAVEIGDGVSMNGVYGGVYSISRSYSPSMRANVSAPYDEEIDHEYPYKPKEDREITRRFSAIESEFRIQSNEISAKVSQTGGDNNSVSWSLTSDAWTVKANGQEVFRIDSSGANVTGIIRATSGAIGGFNINDHAIFNNIDNLENTGNLNEGVYLGTDGIRLGANFKVDRGGNISAVNANLSGTLTVGGSTITAAQLRSGAYSAYTNGGTWSTGSGYGYNYNSAQKMSGGTYPPFFKVSGQMQVNSLVINGNPVTARTLVINNVRHHVWTWAASD